MDKRKVLIVDDEEDFLMITKLNLEDSGKYEVMTLSDANGIVAQVNSFEPDVILLDILMPNVGGIDACKALNADPKAKSIPIIVLSALGRDDDKLNAYKVGVVDYLVKPIEKDALIAKIEKALRYK
ncbi:MAG: response regulator [Candidatus Omnitrophota bacterium]|nr:response regulator [Candidatus Omnitrophota bacterium]